MFRRRYPKKQPMINSVNGGAVRRGARVHARAHTHSTEKQTCKQTLCGLSFEWCSQPLPGPSSWRRWSPGTPSGWCGRSWSSWHRPPCGWDTGWLPCCRLRGHCGGVEKRRRGRYGEDEHTRTSGERAPALLNYPFPHLTLGLSDRNMGRKCMKSSPSGLCLPLGVMGRQCTQEEFTTGRGGTDEDVKPLGQPSHWRNS